jgi:hypothetical protein
MRKNYEATEAIVNATIWSTEQLQGMALAWSDRETAQTPLWRGISGDEGDAWTYYRELLAEDPETARWEAAEVLADGGWTIDWINHRKS